jgi:hypothetical protein
MSSKISPTMRRAIELARANGGKLIRLVGESWCGERLVARYNPKLWMGGMREAAYPSA